MAPMWTYIALGKYFNKLSGVSVTETNSLSLPLTDNLNKRIEYLHSIQWHCSPTPLSEWEHGSSSNIEYLILTEYKP